MLRLLYILYQIVIALPLLLTATILTAVVTMVGCALGDGRFWGYWPAKVWGWVFLKVLLLPVRVEGRHNIDPKTSYVFVANHQGAFDIFLIYAHLGHNLRWMMKKSLRQIPLVGKACESAHQIFVDKSGPKAIKRTYEAARSILQKGASVVVFPEGARTYTGELGTFKKGAFQLADELQLPVVPITLDGPFQVLPRTARLPFVHWHRLSITIHRPIPPHGKGHDNEIAVMQESYNIISKTLTSQK